MKKIITGIMFLLIMSSCKKDTTHCYECDLSSGTGNYTDVGCHSSSEWDKLQFTDANSNTIDKKTKCRIK